MMRLAILASHPVQYYAPLFQHLAKKIDLHVFFSHLASPNEQAAAGFGVPFSWDVDLLSGYEHTFLLNVSKSPDASRYFGCDTPEIGAKLRGGRFDAVLSLGWHLKSQWQGIWAAKRLGLPVLVRGDSQLSTERSRSKRWIKRLAYPKLLRIFDAALYVGARNKAYYTYYGYPSSRLFCSPHCVDTDRFAVGSDNEARNTTRLRLGVGPSVRLLMFAGKLVPFKRPLDVVAAAAELRVRGVDAQVLVAGAGDLEPHMRSYSRTHDVPLHLLGFQNQSEMPAAYAASDTLVLPSTSRETWGLVCNEALACGRPIVVSEAVGCAPDLAADDRVGRRFPLGDMGACADALDDLLKNPPSHAQIAALSNRFSLEAAANGVINALSSVVERRVLGR